MGKTDSSVISVTYGSKLHVVNDALLEGPGVCMQHQGHNHDKEYNMSLNVNPQGWPQIHHCYQQQIAQQQTTLPPVVLVPAGTDRLNCQTLSLCRGRFVLLQICSPGCILYVMEMLA